MRFNTVAFNTITWKGIPDNKQDEVTEQFYWYMICEVMGTGTLATKNKDVLSYTDYLRNLLGSILYDFCMTSGHELVARGYAGWPVKIDVPEAIHIVETYYRYFDFKDPMDVSPVSDTTIHMNKHGKYNEPYSITANNIISTKYDFNDVGNISTKVLDLVSTDLLGYHIGKMAYEYLVVRGQYSKEASSAIAWRLKSQGVDTDYINTIKGSYNMIHTYKPENAPQHVNMVITLEVLLDTNDSFLLEITDCTENWVYARPMYLEKYGENLIKFIRHIKNLTCLHLNRLPPDDPNISLPIGMIKYNLLKSGLMLDCALPDGKNYQYILTTYINDKAMKEETGVLELNSDNWLI